VECNAYEHKNCINLPQKYEKICPISCSIEKYLFTSYAKFYENNNLFFNYYFWDSWEAFISYEETADMLLIDYFTYIGGLFGLWFGNSLETLLDLIVKHTRNLRTKVQYLFL
jgi:hypothetical protein